MSRREEIQHLGAELYTPPSAADWSLAERAYNAIVMAGDALDVIRSAFYVTWSNNAAEETLCSDILRVRVEPADDSDRCVMNVHDSLGDRSWAVSRTLAEFRELRETLKGVRGLAELVESLRFPGARMHLLRQTVTDTTHEELAAFTQQLVHLLFFLGNPFDQGCRALADFLQVEEHSPSGRLLEALNARAPVATLPHPHLPSKIMMAALLSSTPSLNALRSFVYADAEGGSLDGPVLAFCSDFCGFFPHPHTQYSGKDLSTVQVEQLDLLWRTYLEPGAEQSIREHRLAFCAPDTADPDRFSVVLQFEMELEQALARVYLLRFLYSPQHAAYVAETETAAPAVPARTTLASEDVEAGVTIVTDVSGSVQ